MVTSGSCKFHEARAAYTTCKKMDGSCEYLAPGVTKLSAAGSVAGEEYPGVCNYAAGQNVDAQDDGSPGIPGGYTAWTNGTGYVPSEVEVTVGNAVWRYADFGPASVQGGVTQSDGLNIYNDDTNTSATSKRYFMHRFNGKMKLELNVKYKFSIRSKDGAQLWMTSTPGSTATNVLEKTGCNNAQAATCQNAAFNAMDGGTPPQRCELDSAGTGCKVTTGACSFSAAQGGKSCASSTCTAAEFDEKTSTIITGDGYWRNIRVLLAKASGPNQAEFKMRVMKEVSPATATADAIWRSLTVSEMAVHHGEATCDTISGGDSFCSQRCGTAQTDNYWGTYSNTYADPDKRGKKKEGCRFYQGTCCSGEYIQTAPGENDNDQSANFAGAFSANIRSVVCTPNYQAWLFDKTEAEMETGNTADTLFVDGKYKTEVSSGVWQNTGIPCLKRATWDGTASDWSGKVMASKVCAIDQDETSTVTHRRRRGGVNCRASTYLTSGTAGQPEYSGWKSIHYPSAGNNCDFGGGTAYPDNRQKTTSGVALVNVTQDGTRGNAFTPGTGPALAAGAAARVAGDQKYATFDQQLASYNQATCTGTPNDAALTCSLNAAVAATCQNEAGDATDADGALCAVNDAGNSCAVNTGACSFTAAIAAGSACSNTDAGCTYTAADSGYMHEWRGQIKLENNEDYLFAVASDDGSKLWLEGASAPVGTDGLGNTIAQWNGCHVIASTTSDLNSHESTTITGDGKWHKIIIYYANYAATDSVAHMYLRVKKGAGTFLTAAEMNIRHNTGD